MLKNKRNLNIVSRLFDTINKMSLDADIHEDESTYADTLAPAIANVQPNYIVSVPNETQPLKIAEFKPITLCVYQVRTDGLYPYILFLLTNYNDEFSFMKFFMNLPMI